METPRYKYPRTLHLPWTEHMTTDDKIHSSVAHLVGREVVVTEKLDGENTNVYSDYIHARTTTMHDHPSRHWVKGLWGTIRNDIPPFWRICAENVFAEHSIHYRNLESYLYVFGIWDERNVCLGWDDTVAVCESLGLKHVPVLYRGPFEEQKIKACYTGVSVFDGSCDVAEYKKTGNEVPAQEGYVVRVVEPFPFPVGEDNERLCLQDVGKFVRRGHVTTDDHWMQQAIVPNELKK